MLKKYFAEFYYEFEKDKETINSLKEDNNKLLEEKRKLEEEFVKLKEEIRVGMENEE